MSVVPFRRPGAAPDAPAPAPAKGIGLGWLLLLAGGGWLVYGAIKRQGLEERETVRLREMEDRLAEIERMETATRAPTYDRPWFR